MNRRNSHDLGDIEGQLKPIDKFDDIHPDHWVPPADLTGVNRTRLYHGHKLYQASPYLFWRVHSRVDEKPLHASLQNNAFTDLRVCQAAVDEAIKGEAKRT